jgi:hypothetical protein
MFARPRDQVVRVHASSGTTGNPTTVGYTRGDLDVWADLIARTLAAGGVAPGDLLQNAFGYGLLAARVGGMGLPLAQLRGIPRKLIAPRAARRPDGAFDDRLVERRVCAARCSLGASRASALGRSTSRSCRDRSGAPDGAPGAFRAGVVPDEVEKRDLFRPAGQGLDNMPGGLSAARKAASSATTRGGAAS